MRQTDFASSLQKFFTEHLIHQRACSDNTVKSYRDTFKLFLRFMSERRATKPDKMTLARFTAEEVGEFGKFLSKVRKNSARTRNQRTAAIHSFVAYLQYEYPEMMFQWQKILAMQPQRQTDKPVAYLSQKEIAAVMASIRPCTRVGIRDKAMILLLYDTGARVQELVDITASDIRLGKLSQVTLRGKGEKMRIVPLMPTTIPVIKKYMETYGLTDSKRSDDALFCNRRGEKISRFGVSYILAKYAEKARTREPSLPKQVSPHLLRHSKAMHLLEEGCSDVVIQHLLGHSDLRTTGIYAKANKEMVRDALEKVNKKKSPPVEEFSWNRDAKIMQWLDEF